MKNLLKEHCTVSIIWKIHDPRKSLLNLFVNGLKKWNICHLNLFEYKFEVQSLKFYYLQWKKNSPKSEIDFNSEVTCGIV